MNLLKAPEFKVGLMVLIVAAIIAGMALRASNNPGYLGTQKSAWFYIDDASGLVKNSNVRTAGINVGIIKDIKLENGQARVEMVLQGDLPLTKSARIEIRPNGILGDKHVEVIMGDPRDPPMRSGEQILVVDDRASVDRLMAEVSKITKSLSSVAENIRAATEGESDKPLGRIISNLEQITGDLAVVTKNNKEDVTEIIQNVHRITETLDTIVSDDSEDGLKQSLQAALRGLRRIDSSLKNIEDITGKINRGEGTIGKLVNDDRTVEEINTAVESISGMLETAAKASTSIDYNSYYLSNGVGAKSMLSLRLQPGLDRYYEVGIVNDATGVTRRTTTRTNTDGTISTVEESKTYEDRLKFNAMFAKNFYDFTLRGGIIESTGGFGVDYYALRRKLRLSFEAFDFSNLNLRASARYNVFHGIYLTGGGEDLASKSGNAGAFVGAGLLLTNDDLKLLLTRVPF